MAGTGTISPYERLGGDGFVTRFVARFYALMDSLPEARACRAAHGVDLAPARRKLHDYLTGWLGGPPLFVERHGPVMLRRRHLPFAIGADAVAGWLVCFNRAWSELVDDAEISATLLPQIEAMARHVRNRD